MTKQTIALSLLCASLLHAADAALEPIVVESTTIDDVSGEAVKSADLAEALSTEVPSINLIRRSGIANDILLRGQKRDNINVTIDDTKIYGACPNRMDPPTSHVVTHNIESVEIIEGPFNVEDFGTLSGQVKVTTKEPTKEVEGQVNVNMGSFGYKKVGASVSGGTDRVQFMLVGSTEWGDQYEDGNGRTLAEQNAIQSPVAGPEYKPAYADMEAFEKKTMMAKVNVNVTDNQQLKLSYTNNQSDDILYPNTGMDAIYDNSKIYNLEYIVRDLGAASKALSVQAYRSQVDHPMTTYYRNSSGPNSANEVINHLTTDMQGVKIKNSFEAARTDITVGLDASDRNWDGHYVGFGAMAGITGRESIRDADTENRAVFAEASRRFGDLELKAGARYDDTTVSSVGTLLENDYESISANVYATYNVAENTSLFGGIGRSNRVPDARELYFHSSSGAYVGTDGLKETTNHEIDLGVEQSFGTFGSAKFKGFYSKLKDYIYHSRSAGEHQFDNIDATIYGAELSGAVYPMEALSVDFGLTYLRGKKDDLPVGHTDKDLADITPLKGNLGVSYAYLNDSYARVEFVAADSWDTFDSDTGEQKLGGYGIVNLKLSHDVTESFNLTAGIDNLFDKAYAVSNTYSDLTLLSTGTEVMLLNEPGRYAYINATYKF